MNMTGGLSVYLRRRRHTGLARRTQGGRRSASLRRVHRSVQRHGGFQVSLRSYLLRLVVELLRQGAVGAYIVQHDDDC